MEYCGRWVVLVWCGHLAHGRFNWRRCVGMVCGVHSTHRDGRTHVVDGTIHPPVAAYACACIQFVLVLRLSVCYGVFCASFLHENWLLQGKGTARSDDEDPSTELASIHSSPDAPPAPLKPKSTTNDALFKGPNEAYNQFD
jgi:hypothetical protein